MASFRSFVPFSTSLSAPFTHLPTPPPHRFWAVGTWSICTIKVFSSIFGCCAMMTAQWTASFSFTTTKNGSPIRKLTPSPYIFVRYFEKRYTPSWIKPEDGAHTRRARQRRGRHPLFMMSLFQRCVHLCIGTKSGTCRWRTKGADVTLSFQRFQTTFYAIIKIRRKSK